MDGSGARRLGERLVGGVEGEGLSEVSISKYFPRILRSRHDN